MEEILDIYKKPYDPTVPLVCMDAVSYTHLDVYKRQQIDLLILDSKNKWVSVPLIPNLCAFVDVLFCLLNHYSKNSTWYFVLPPYFR